VTPFFGIAGVQMLVSAAGGNLETMRRHLSTLMAIFPWVRMVVFSELAVSGPSSRTAQPLPGPSEEALRAMAAEHRLWLVSGSMYERDGDRVHNTASVIDPEGLVVGRYRKMFPFEPYELGISPGDEFLVFDVPDVGRFGLCICYDIWFPEVPRTLAVMGAEVILRPTLTGTIDRDLELSIARATAAANQCFVFDINGVGDGGYGRSIVCSPEGTVLYEAGSGEETIPLEINLGDVRRSREHGILRLGQPLKSFRDSNVDFSIYRPGARHPYLESLGPLEKPARAGPKGVEPQMEPHPTARGE
jgi:predicted amidohydrolase